MKDVNGIWLPDHEQHLLEYAAKGDNGKWTYQLHKLLEAYKYSKGTTLAIDVGGHCGLWSKELVKLFDNVVAFEPVQEHRECYVKNVKANNYTLHPVALGEKEGTCSIHTSKGSSGDSWVDGTGDIPVKTLDSFNLDPDFIKLDCEGYEYFALKGGEEMLKRAKPCIIVEQKPGKAKNFGLKETQAVTYLLSLGAKLRGSIAGDYILSWDE
jgi:FkbM family methyltransferase